MITSYTGQGRLFLNDGAARFVDATAGRLPTRNDVVLGVALVDFDIDGDADILLASASAVRFEINDGTGRFATAPASVMPSQPFCESLAVGDVDGDGDLDAYIGIDGQDRLFLNDRGLEAIDVLARAGIDERRSTRAVAFGDVDGDGDLDAITANDQSAADQLLLNAGDGSFAPAPAGWFPAPSTSSSGVALGDVDADGDLDAVIAGQPAVRLLINDGTGRFAAAGTDRVPSIPSAVAVELGDFDGDGDLDILAIGTNAMLVNDGSGVFTQRYANTGDSTARSSAIGDIDADGDLDLVVGSTRPGAGSSLAIRLNRGDAVFLDLSTAPSVAFDVTALALADLDGDRDLDLLVATARTGWGSPELLLENVGGARFVDVTDNLPSRGASYRTVVAFDADGDGDIDLLVDRAATPRSLFLNEGGMRFSYRLSGDELLADPIAQALAAADLDGDRDVDVWIATERQDRVSFGARRQLWTPHLPRVGHPLALDVLGVPSGVWLLNASFLRADIPTPFGTLRLPPHALIPVTSGVLDARGRARHVLPVSPDAALIGVSVYWQAIVTEVGLTNLVVTTLTGA